MTGYKITDQKMQTYGKFQWELNVTKVPNPTKDRRGLCGPGWLHFYSDPLIAMFFYSYHTYICNPRLFECECKGEIRTATLISGCDKMTLLKELPVIAITDDQKIKFGILCALKVYQEKDFVNWATNWLNGSDRSKESAVLMNQKVSALFDLMEFRTNDPADIAVAIANYAISAASKINIYDARLDVSNVSWGVQRINKDIDFVKIAKQAMEP